MGLGQRVTELLGKKAEMPRTSGFDRIYHEQFQFSGIRKAMEVLKELQDRTDVDLSKCAYFSVGGSTGSELFHVLNNSTIPCGILLEYSPDAAEIARERWRKLSLQGKKVVVITGDATQQLNRCKDQLLEWRDLGKISGTVVSAQAVLHELPTRSPGFDLGHFMGEICWDWDPFLFYSREPCSPVDWPEEVEIHVPELNSSLLEALAKDIQASLQIPGQLLRSGPEWVAMPRDLAVEAIFKIIFLNDYQHEIQERVTSIDPTTLRTVLESLLGANSTALVRRTSDSFRQKYRELGIQARKRPMGERLFMPETFAWITAERVNPPSRRTTHVRPEVSER